MACQLWSGQAERLQSSRRILASLSKRLLQIGRGIIRRQGSDVALMGYGTAVNECLAAAEILAKSGIKATVADMRYAVPASLPGLWGAV